MNHLYKTPWFVISLALAMVLFSALYWTRFHRAPSFISTLTPITDAGEKTHPGDPIHETWKSIYIQKEKAGFAMSKLDQTETGYRSEEKAFFRFNTMGMVQDINMETRAHLKHDFSLESFSMTIHSSLFTFKASGTTQGNRLKISTSGADQTQTEHEIEFDSPPYLAGGILLDLAASLKTGKKSKTYDLFDPVTMAFLPATAEVKGIESIEAFGKQTDALMVDLSFKGATQTLWMDQKGRILLESGMLGMRIKAVEQQEALTGINSAPVQDMTRLASVRADRKIHDPEALNTLVVDISGIDVNQYPFRTRRQRLAGKRLTIKKERIPNTHTSHIPFDLRKLTKPGPFIQSDTPEIMALAQEITQGETLAVNKVRKLVDWVYKNIEKRPSPSIPDALSTLKTRKGDCNEHAVLLAALGRAAGIPTRVETGLYYLDGKFMYHAWNAFYTGAWITADGVFNQIPADVTHIRIASSKKGTGTELTGVIGNIQLKIIEMN